MRLLAAGLSAILIASGCSAQARADDLVFPADLCQQLPDASDAAQAFAAQNAPEFSAAKLAGTKLKEMTLEIGLAAIGKAADRKLSNIDVFSGEIAREKCAVEVPANVLSALDAAFDLHLVMALSGNDTDGKPFKMISLLAWNGLLYIVYDRDGITHYDESTDRKFKFERVIRIETPKAGLFETISGIQAHVGIVGYLTVSQCEKTDLNELHFKVGYLGSNSPADPITRKSEKIAAVKIAPNLSSPAVEELKQWATAPGLTGLP
jgi:hypothetical protein